LFSSAFSSDDALALVLRLFLICILLPQHIRSRSLSFTKSRPCFFKALFSFSSFEPAVRWSPLFRPFRFLLWERFSFLLPEEMRELAADSALSSFPFFELRPCLNFRPPFPSSFPFPTFFRVKTFSLDPLSLCLGPRSASFLFLARFRTHHPSPFSWWVMSAFLTNVFAILSLHHLFSSPGRRCAPPAPSPFLSLRFFFPSFPV